MKRVVPPALVVAMVLVAVALTGCANWFADPAKPANDAIISANGHLKTAAAAGTEIQTLTDQLSGVALTAAGGKQSVDLLAQIDAKLATQTGELTAAKKSLDSVSALNVKQEFKQYAKLEVASVRTRIAVTAIEARMYASMQRLYRGLKAGTHVDQVEISGEIGAFRAEMDAMNTTAAQQEKAASDYFTAKKLGQ